MNLSRHMFTHVSAQHHLWHLRAEAQSGQVFQTGQPLHEKGLMETLWLTVAAFLLVWIVLHSCSSVLTLQHGQQLYRHIYLGCKELSSGRQHYETLFTLLGLLSVELANEEVVVDLIRLALALQVPGAGNGLSWFIASPRGWAKISFPQNKNTLRRIHQNISKKFTFFLVFKNDFCSMITWKKKSVFYRPITMPHFHLTWTDHTNSVCLVHWRINEKCVSMTLLWCTSLLTNENHLMWVSKPFSHIWKVFPGWAVLITCFLLPYFVFCVIWLISK